MMTAANHQIAGNDWPNAQKNHPVVCDILSRFFKHVMPLPVYLSRIFPYSDAYQIKNIFSADSNHTVDTLSKLSNLQDAVVACNLDQLPHFPDPNLTCKPKKDQEWLYETLKDVIVRAQATILRNQETTFSSNILTLGYRKADDRSTVMKMVGNICISNIHVNACVTQILMGQEWFILLQAIGEVAMEHILTYTALFVPLNAPAQSNLVQVLGQSIGEMKELSRSSKEEELECSKGDDNRVGIRRNCKRKQPSNASEQPIKRLRKDSLSELQRKPTEVDLLRNRIFYAKLSRTRMGGIVKGLPINHVLQRMFSEKLLQRHPSKFETPDQHALLEARAKLLCKHIWPREFGLKNVFCSKNAQNSTQQEYELRMALSSREEEIRICGKIRTPERLLNSKKLLKLMILKHDRFDYRRALELCCPTSLPKRKLTRAERDVLVEELSESVVPGKAETQKDHNIVAETQFETQCHSIGMNSEEEDSDHDEPELITKKNEKPRYTKYKTPHGCVARFIRYVLRSIVPIELFGSQHNRDIVFKACDEFVGLRRYESFNLHQISQGFRILDCEWSLPREKVSRNQRPTKEENLKRQNLANELLFWLFDSIIMPLLRTNFYATESAKFRNHVLYFRADVWDKITEPIIENLKDEKFQKIGKHKAVGIMSRRAFGYSFVRLLPKEVGMRPIMNLRRRSTKIDRRINAANRSSSKNSFQRKKSNNDEWGQLVVSSYSINNIMNATFQVLNFERQDNPNALGSSVFGPHDVFVRLSNFKTQLQKRYGERLPPLYFVKMDVAGAFDCIDQTTLLKIVDGIVRHDRYIVQRYNKLTSSNGQPFRTWPKIACPEEEHEPFQLLAQHLAQMQAWRNTILADSVSYPQCDRKSLVWLLNEHINNNLIKVGKDFCRQRVGIPQGSTLSTLLCCYYLARMESHLHLTESSAEQTRDSLLMRYTDDFLFISPNKELARQFFTSVHQGSEDFNCSIAAEKTECNFKMYDASMESNLANAALAVQVRSDSSPNGQGDVSFPWCSYKINTESLSVRYDLDRYNNTCVADSLTIPNRKPFKSLLSNMIAQSVQRQNLPIYLDVSLNSIKGVLRNIHQMYLVATIKFVSAYQELIKRDKNNKSKIRGNKFIHDSILSNIEHAFAHACAKMNQIRLQEQQQSPDNVSAPWKIPLVTYRWMALHSIISILEMRPSTQKMNITQSLSDEMRKAAFQIKKQVRITTSVDCDHVQLLNKTFLYQQTSKSLKQARPILRSLKMQR